MSEREERAPLNNQYQGIFSQLPAPQPISAEEELALRCAPLSRGAPRCAQPLGGAGLRRSGLSLSAEDPGAPTGAAQPGSSSPAPRVTEFSKKVQEQVHNSTLLTFSHLAVVVLSQSKGTKHRSVSTTSLLQELG